MSKRHLGPTWSRRQLEKRGWTPELIQSLLPKPTYLYLYGKKPLGVWLKDTVAAAEAGDVFQAHLAALGPEAPAVTRRPPEEPAQQAQAPSPPPEQPAPKPKGKKPPKEPKEDPRTHAQRAADALKEAWDKAEKDDDPAWRLAACYHQALQRTMPARPKKGMSLAQGKGCLDAFLSLETSCQADRIPIELGRLGRTGEWLGKRLTSPLPLVLQARYPYVLRAAAGQALAEFSSAQPEANLDTMLTTPGFPVSQLLSRTIGYLYSVWYVPQAIRTSLEVLVALNPKDEYPEARAMSRHFILHIGGTNTGKTYAGFQRLKQAATGVYLAPLRLLALEAQETLLDAGVDCTLSTGEEEDRREWDTHVAATAEKLDLSQRYDVAVIDECQMIADPQRGYAWTRAILGVLAPEVHLCAAPQAKDLLIRLIESCGNSYEVQVHQRKTPLLPMAHPIDYTQVKPGDALITFSKLGVLRVAEDLRQEGKEPAIIYGALPHSTRRKQMEGFLQGKMDYVVATDAIGMGLNLPIRRIIFMDTEKFDGVERRELKPEEIQQIAGRAGRYGMYDTGYVGATQNLELIRMGLRTTVPPLEQAVVGFSDMVLRVDFDLLEVLTQWSQMPTAEPYVKLDISRYLSLISKIREQGFTLTKAQELRAANIPFDEEDEPLRLLFFSFLRLWQDGAEALPCPALEEGSARSLPELELFCRKLDLYFSFSKSFGYAVDEDALYDLREDAAEEINEILLHRLKSNIRFCALCGAPLPLHTKGRLCGPCRNKEGQKHRSRRHR